MNESRLPESYDELVRIDKLEHGEHNPRRVPPSEELRSDIESKGIRQPLVVRPKDGTDKYYITDGWQRYQAAAGIGWETVPVNIYYNIEDALSEAESQSIGREWGTFEWARHCESVATTVNVYNERDVVKEVTSRVNKSRPTVKKYLHAMRLPEEVLRTVVDDTGRGSESDWDALQNYNENVRKYDGISWQVAAELGKHSSNLQDHEMIKLAAHAAPYDAEGGVDFIKLAIDNMDIPIGEIHKMLAMGKDHDDYLALSRTAIPMDPDKKESLHEYCRRRRRRPSEIAEELIVEFADAVHENDDPPSVKQFLE